MISYDTIHIDKLFNARLNHRDQALFRPHKYTVYKNKRNLTINSRNKLLRSKRKTNASDIQGIKIDWLVGFEALVTTHAARAMHGLL